jgi:hypothetical protein
MAGRARTSGGLHLQLQFGHESWSGVHDVTRLDIDLANGAIANVLAVVKAEQLSGWVAVKKVRDRQRSHERNTT